MLPGKVNPLLGAVVALSTREDDTEITFALLHDPPTSPGRVLPQTLIS
jgi:hypothetical protein